MPDYRFYALGSPEHAVAGEHHEFADDQAAIEMARMMCDHHGIEIWEGQRHVARVTSSDEPLITLEFI
jgi:hypothetical protein